MIDTEMIEEKIGEVLGLEMAAQKAVEQLVSKGLLAIYIWTIIHEFDSIVYNGNICKHVQLCSITFFCLDSSTS